MSLRCTKCEFEIHAEERFNGKIIIIDHGNICGECKKIKDKMRSLIDNLYIASSTGIDHPNEPMITGPCVCKNE